MDMWRKNDFSVKIANFMEILRFFVLFEVIFPILTLKKLFLVVLNIKID